jgi:hypothetical protein
MMRPDAKVEKVYLYPKPVDFRKSIDGLAALVELDIKVAVFAPHAFRLSQQASQPREDFVLGAKRLLPLGSSARNPSVSKHRPMPATRRLL